MSHTLCRTMFCPHCSAAGRPKKHTMYVVYGFTSQQIRVRKSKHDGIVGFTPHLVTYENNKTGIVPVTITCGIHGCGVTIGKEKKDGTHDVVIERVDVLHLPRIQYLALLGRWRNTGYEIL